MRVFALPLLAAMLLAQDNQPEFEAADVHASPQGARNTFFRGTRAQGGLFTTQFATIVDLISQAYGFNENEIVGGPSWLEMDKFDIVAKLPPNATRETQNQMLRTLLEERFQLAVHQDVQPMPAMALTIGKKHQLKPGEVPSENRCQFVQPTQPPGARGPAEPGTFFLPTFGYDCKAITMAKFAEVVRDMLDNNDKPVVDRTGLEGGWNFSFRFTPSIRGPFAPANETTSITQAIEKLGFKLEPVKAPVPVLIVDRANETPTPNAENAAAILKVAAPATEFEVAEIKPSDPSGPPGSRTSNRNGRMTMQGLTIKLLIQRAWNMMPDMIFNLPKFAEQDRFDIVAKLPVGQNFDPFSQNPPLQALLKERFKLAIHMEDRPVDAFTLVAVKPKMQKADPASRTRFREGPGADGKDPRNGNPSISRLVTVKNMTMKQFAASLSQIAGGYIRTPLPVVDATGLEGSYDFTLSFSPIDVVQNGGRGGRIGDAPVSAPGISEPSDPSGGISLFDALEKQLGLKLEKHKRPAPCLVVDHVEQKPTEN